MSLPNPYPEHRAGHPHRRRLPRHARHIIRQLLKLRVATRASVLTAHARQLDSAVNLREHPGRLHADSDRSAPGVRVVVGPETRSLLKQLLDSRDLRVQQQIVREILHQLQKRTLAALKRVRAAEKAREKAREKAGQASRATRRGGVLLLRWFRVLPARARTQFGTRAARTAGSRKPVTRTVGNRTPATRKPAVRKPAERTARPRATRE